ncbi:expressed unknown protein [Seminavis robusta]|uniref:Uncharacterized protein n=1 Tax=Seminavis robusta TaxID=568900 RepID=A0A9N8H2H3_9STRA|nr:expressed unknown protein [Seminavis robusta]|eukprot:Sro9_g007160.1 n/a (350) ;mRNA; f:67229-68278
MRSSFNNDLKHSDSAEQELRLQDVFESTTGINSSTGTASTSMSPESQGSEHSSSSGDGGGLSEDLVRQFNASVGSASLHRSVAEFYLEMSAHDVGSAVSFFKQTLNHPSAKQQQEQSQEQSPPPRRSLSPRPSHSATARRLKSHDHDMSGDGAAIRPRRQTPKRNKSFDAAEAPTVTAPPAERTNHQHYIDRTCSPGLLPQKATTTSIPRYTSVAVTPAAMKVPFRGHRSKPAMPLVRSKSERRVREYTANTAMSTTAHTHPGHPSRQGPDVRQCPPRTRSSDSSVFFKQHDCTTGTGHYYQYQNDSAAVTRPPTAQNNHYQRAISARQLHSSSWEPPSGTPLSSNPAA